MAKAQSFIGNSRALYLVSKEKLHSWIDLTSSDELVVSLRSMLFQPTYTHLRGLVYSLFS